jgi:hypothetical protein
MANIKKTSNNNKNTVDDLELGRNHSILLVKIEISVATIEIK